MIKKSDLPSMLFAKNLQKTMFSAKKHVQKYF
jgi:hypothetical protein